MTTTTWTMTGQSLLGQPVAVVASGDPQNPQLELADGRRLKIDTRHPGWHRTGDGYAVKVAELTGR